MSEYNKVGLLIFLAVIVVVFCTFIANKLKERKRRNDRTKEYQSIQKINRRATATEYAAQLQRLYLMTLYINRR